ncbi:hypothetical protein MLD38_017355 [Melastoma candidum]|uniref:Uncharacterized protein n=1 Tax=Melastoma candidum TaxID=119954 RepID=A0ACB9QRH8_9MYRT|nr:hypothetical protein MLD38_017355 [Melastoma candidum]
MRLMFEKEFSGREVMNVIACEGTERVERPETYKQWQIRNTRAGFRPLPLDLVIMKKLKSKLKEGYLEEFLIDEDGQWILQGWKGQILYASSCWVFLFGVAKNGCGLSFQRVPKISPFEMGVMLSALVHCLQVVAEAVLVSAKVRWTGLVSDPGRA